MTAPTLDQMLDAAGAHARIVIIDRQEEMLPIFHLVDGEGQDVIVGTDFTGDTPEEVIDCKDAVAAHVRSLIVKHKIVQYSFMSEAWMIVRHKYTEGVSTPPADSADRVEVVIATAQDSKNYESRRWLIKRDKDGKCVDLVLDVIEGETPKPSGRFDSLLEPL